MDSEGKVKWRYDAKFKAMGAPAVIDLGASDERVVAMFEREHYLSILPLFSAEQGTVSFLVGGRGQVWRYSSSAR